MPLLSVILNALTPIAFVILLGYLAGKLDWIKASSSGIFAVLALEFCLPSLLFNATATMPTAEFHNWQFFLGIALGLLIIYLLAFAIAHRIFGKTVAQSSLQALCSAFPNMAFMGVPLLISIFGTQAVLSVVIGNLISSFVLIPITLTLLEAGSVLHAGHTGAVVLRRSLIASLRKPLVWAPLAGVIMAFAHIALPEVAQKSLLLIGNATSGVALFAMGLVLSGQHLRLRASVVTNLGFKNLVQPVIMWGLAIALHVDPIHRREMILLGALPTASMTAMFAVRHDVYTDEATATVLASTILSIATISVAIALTH